MEFFISEDFVLPVSLLKTDWVIEDQCLQTLFRVAQDTIPVCSFCAVSCRMFVRVKLKRKTQEETGRKDSDSTPPPRIPPVEIGHAFESRIVKASDGDETGRTNWSAKTQKEKNACKNSFFETLVVKGVSEARTPTAARGEGEGRQEGGGQGGDGTVRHGRDGQAGDVEAGRRPHAGKGGLRPGLVWRRGAKLGTYT